MKFHKIYITCDKLLKTLRLLSRLILLVRMSQSASRQKTTPPRYLQVIQVDITELPSNLPNKKS
jgi:hypothetical protein